MALTNLLTLSLFLGSAGFAHADLRLPSYYMYNMVFQADQDQTMLFGFTTDPDVPVLVTVTCEEEVTFMEAEPAGFKAKMDTSTFKTQNLLSPTPKFLTLLTT